MGQKVHPYGFRVGFTKPWRSRWFAKQGYAKLLQEDLEIKEDLRKRLKSAGVSSIEVDRPGNKLRVTIRTSRPGIIIGRKGAEIEKLKGDLAKSTKREVFIDIQEVHKPELDAQLVSESVALQLEKRVAFRRAMRKAVDSALRFGCKGIKVRVSGRLNGAEIARSEWYLQGQLPLHTIRADIDYGFTEAHTTYGVIGIKAWVYKGEIIEGKRRSLTGDPEPRRERQDRPDRERRPRRDDGRGGDSRGGDGRSDGRSSDGRPQRDRDQPAPLAGQGDTGGAPTQAAPGDMARPARSSGSLMPPLMSPSQSNPSWKQEVRPETAAPEPQPETSALPPESGHADPQSNAPEDKTGHGGEE